MKSFFSILILFLHFAAFSGKANFNGTWQGVIVKSGLPIEKSTIVYVDFNINDGVVSGLMREESYGTEFYALKMINGKVEGNALNFKQIVVKKKKSSSRIKWCLTQGSLEYDSITGYLKGKFTSSDCKRLMGEIILYRSNFELSKDDVSQSSHIWFSQFTRDYQEGLYAPEIRKLERENFVFEPIFFDFDKSDIRPEHYEFLNSMIKVVKGHTDLRVKVIGHTDAEGSNGYNVGLSERRAKAIIAYFTSHGLDADRLEFHFYGETKPAATNDTKEGRQRNRRVDFEFI